MSFWNTQFSFYSLTHSKTCLRRRVEWNAAEWNEWSAEQVSFRVTFELITQLCCSTLIKKECGLIKAYLVFIGEGKYTL